MQVYGKICSHYVRNVIKVFNRDGMRIGLAMWNSVGTRMMTYMVLKHI